MYFGEGDPSVVVGGYENLMRNNKAGVLLRCDDIDGSACKRSARTWALLIIFYFQIVSKTAGGDTGEERTPPPKPSSATLPTPTGRPTSSSVPLATLFRKALPLTTSLPT